MPVGNGQQAGMYPHPHQNIATIPQMNVLLQQGLHPPQHQFGNPIQMQNVVRNSKATFFHIIIINVNESWNFKESEQLNKVILVKL